MYPTRYVDIEVKIIGRLQGQEHTETIVGDNPRAIARQVRSWMEMTIENQNMPDVPSCERVLVTTDDPMYAISDGIVLDLEVGEDTSPEEVERKVLCASDANAGGTCEECGEVIQYGEGCSSPIGSLHKTCAEEHEAENPAVW